MSKSPFGPSRVAREQHCSTCNVELGCGDCPICCFEQIPEDVCDAANTSFRDGRYAVPKNGEIECHQYWTRCLMSLQSKFLNRKTKV